MSKLNKSLNRLERFANLANPIVKNASEKETAKKAGEVLTFKIISQEVEDKPIFLPNPFVKIAFDTRRVDQENDRNPRANLQYWHRTDPFITESDEKKLSTFARLMTCLNDIKDEFGTQPEWFESYARQLYDNVNRILRIKQGDLDIFGPQINYLEQLMTARYRMSMEELSNIELGTLKAKLLGKDEALIKRGNYMKEMGLVADGKKKENIIIDGNGGKTTQDSIINAIFGNQPITSNGKSAERTITITIKDNVLE